MVYLCKLRKQNQLLKNQNDSLRSGNLPLTVKKRAATDLLKGKFTTTKIQQLLKPIKTFCTILHLAQLNEGVKTFIFLEKWF